MRMRTGSRSSGALLAFGVIVMAGCGAAPESDAPPFDELPLREALGADPSVIAALPADARARLRDRFIAAATLPKGDEITATDMSAPTVEKRVRTVDAARERDGHDSFVLAVLDERGGRGVPVGKVVNAPTVAIALEPGDANAPLSSTRALETAALGEKAGALIESLARASSAHHVARKTGWPVAAVAEGDTVYVNAAWLVAMAPDAAEVAVSAPPAATPIAYAPSPRPAQPAADPVVEDEPLDDGGTDEPAGAALRDTWKEPCSAACDREANDCTKSCSDSCSQTCSKSCPKCHVAGRRERPTPLGMLRSFALIGLAFVYVGISARRSRR